MSYIIENIIQKEVNTKFGPKPAYTVISDGERYGYGFKKPTFSIGDEVDFQFTENTYGKNVDLNSVQLLKKSTSTSPPITTTTAVSKGSYTPATKVFPIPALHGDRAIVRQNSITNATKVIMDMFTTDSDLVSEDLANEIIRIAKMFEAYSCGDLDMDAATKLAEAKEG
tara:strand:- start:314 stop:820 length:507 start_codon:yes stop_codon:yes gene_type:complete